MRMAGILQSEIIEQPQVLARLLNDERDVVEKIAEAIRARAPRYITALGRSLPGKRLFQFSTTASRSFARTAAPMK